MEAIAKAIQPMELSEFKNLGPHMPTTIIDIPEKMENRVPTDRYFTIVFGVCVVLLMPFLFHTLAYSDLRRLRGTDDCGNVCGGVNDKYDQWNCTGQDFTAKKYLREYSSRSTENGDQSDSSPNVTYKKCVDACEFLEIKLDGRCTSFTYENLVSKSRDREFEGLGAYLSRGGVIFRFIVCSLIAVGVSIGVVYLFRYAVGIVVWTIIIGVFILSVILVIFMWIDTEDERYGDTALQVMCWISTIFVFVYAGLVYFLRDKIRLFILLLSETTNAIFAMPSMLIVPIFTFLAEGVICSLFITTTICMGTAGELTEIASGRLEYVATGTMSTTLFFNAVITVWSLYFVNGLQYMVIGGAVSEWYFAQEKRNIAEPVKRSVTIAYKFHLGTVAFGSLIITLAELIRYMIKSIMKSRWLRSCVDFCLARVEELLEFVTKRAYIITAMHGQPFLKSGKRAATLIIQNVVNITAVNFIGKLILGVAKLLIALVTVLICRLVFLGEDQEYISIVLLIIFFMALFIGMTFIALFQTTIDTIFICFCEDSLLNDGMARPYAMSKELMEFADNSKKVYGEKQQNYAQFDPAISQPV